MPDQNKELYFVVVAGVILGLILVGFIVTIIFLYQRRRQQHAEAMELLKDKYEKESLRSELEIQENTLKNLSQELHDNIGQMLSVVKISLATVPIPADHSAYMPIKTSREMLNKAILDLSNVTKSLHTDRIVEIGLPAAILFELETVKKAGLLVFQFSVSGEEASFDKQTTIFIFRIFQEILNNVLKHAKANTVIVTVQYENDQFLLRIADDGVGFDVAGTLSSDDAQRGVGLRSLYNRAELINASLNLNSSPNEGSTFSIQLPLQKQEIYG